MYEILWMCSYFGGHRSYTWTACWQTERELGTNMPVGAIPFPFGICRICKDKATGVHYGVATCEGCKVRNSLHWTKWVKVMHTNRYISDVKVFLPYRNPDCLCILWDYAKWLLNMFLIVWYTDLFLLGMIIFIPLYCITFYIAFIKY